MKAPQWYRIDKSNGQITASSGVNVWRAAQGYFEKPQEVIASGRFQTPFCIYSRGDLMRDEEWDRGSLAPAGCPL